MRGFKVSNQAKQEEIAKLIEERNKIEGQLAKYKKKDTLKDEARIAGDGSVDKAGLEDPQAKESSCNDAKSKPNKLSKDFYKKVGDQQKIEQLYKKRDEITEKMNSSNEPE